MDAAIDKDDKVIADMLEVWLMIGGQCHIALEFALGMPLVYILCGKRISVGRIRAVDVERINIGMCLFFSHWPTIGALGLGLDWKCFFENLVWQGEGEEG